MKKLLLFLIFYGISFAYAQFHITNLSPARNALNVNRNATISVQLNGNIDGTTLNFNNAKIYGSQTGFYTAGSWSGGGTSTVSLRKKILGYFFNSSSTV
ncbi:MAG: hypothetical protein EAZ97_14675 [Bacteroidetes bacterium]|nr:MAG: hypothetical protein EAZ97_14675 [Bacteroidota bacterium]